jgi:hypothetical protein
MRPRRLDPGRAGRWVAHVLTVAGRHRVLLVLGEGRAGEVAAPRVWWCDRLRAEQGGRGGWSQANGSNGE